MDTAPAWTEPALSSKLPPSSNEGQRIKFSHELDINKGILSFWLRLQKRRTI